MLQELLYHCRKIMKGRAGLEAKRQWFSAASGHISGGLQRPVVLLQRLTSTLGESGARCGESNGALSAFQ